MASNERGYGKAFIRDLVKVYILFSVLFFMIILISTVYIINLIMKLIPQERLELAERVMVTRLHLYGRWIKV